MPIAGSAIQFEAVNFHYPSRPQQQALKNFHLNVLPGQTVAIVGPSGAGKSTVFQLLLRYYDPQSGSIVLDGSETRQLALDALRQRVGIVPQDAVIFSSSAIENIRYGKPGATDAETDPRPGYCHGQGIWPTRTWRRRLSYGFEVELHAPSVPRSKVFGLQF